MSDHTSIPYLRLCYTVECIYVCVQSIFSSGLNWRYWKVLFQIYEVSNSKTTAALGIVTLRWHIFQRWMGRRYIVLKTERSERVNIWPKTFDSSKFNQFHNFKCWRLTARKTGNDFMRLVTRVCQFWAALRNGWCEPLTSLQSEQNENLYWCRQMNYAASLLEGANIHNTSNNNKL